LNAPAEAVKRALQHAWSADEPLEKPPLGTVAGLARQKYATRDWNCKF
jgi:hypothetical protein